MLFAVFAVLCALSVDAQEPLVVTVSGGQLQGASVGTARQFLGIPYALPPLGALRFKRPQPAASWSGIRNAMFFAPDCAQHKTAYVEYHNISEDCLYLNVFTPMRKPAAPLPVMVFFYGGSWEWGGTSFPVYDGLVDENLVGDTIIVTVNYRLGPFGYLASKALQAEDPQGSTGNYGIQDQRLALRWVAANIGVFNGDPKRVTIWGESAGAGSVACHLVMPASRGLFQGAIMESGPPANWTTVSLAVAEAHYQRMVVALKCNGSEAQVLACLRSQTMDMLIKDQETNHDTPVGWTPVVDGVELTDIPPQLVRHGNFTRVPVLFGTNKDEGSTFVSLSHSANSTDYQRWLLNEFGSQLAPDIPPVYPLSQFKTPWYAASRLYGDVAMSCPTRRNARWFTQASGAAPVYQYFFTRAPVVTKVNEFLGVFHGSELAFVFNFYPFLIEGQERALGKKVATMWTNFAISGSPNGPKATNVTAWPAYDVATDAALDIDIEPTVVHKLKSNECDFWDKVYFYEFPK